MMSFLSIKYSFNKDLYILRHIKMRGAGATMNGYVKKIEDTSKSEKQVLFVFVKIK